MLGWNSTDLAKFSDTPDASPLRPLLNAIPFVNKPHYQKNLIFSIGQNIYTHTTEIPTPCRVIVRIPAGCGGFPFS